MSHQPRESFSRPRDFAIAIAPIIVGIGIFVLKTYLSGETYLRDALYTGLARNYFLQDTSAIFLAATFSLFTFEIIFGLRLLHQVKKLEEWEEKNESKK